MHIFKIKLHEFKEIIDFKIIDLNKYDIEVDCIDDSQILQVPPEIKIDRDYHIRRYKFALSNSEVFNYSQKGKGRKLSLV